MVYDITILAKNDDTTILAKKFDDITILAKKFDDITILADKNDDITILAEKTPHYDIGYPWLPLQGYIGNLKLGGLYFFDGRARTFPTGFFGGRTFLPGQNSRDPVHVRYMVP